MYYHYSFIFILFLLACGKPQSSSDIESELIKLEMEERRLLVDLSIRNYADSVQLRWKSFDSSRNLRLKDMLGDKSWFSRETVGPEGLTAASALLLSSSDYALIKQALPEIQKQAQNGDILKKFYAFLVDRTRHADSLPLVYGTIQHEVDGKLIPFPTEDSLNLNKRRIEVGLPTHE